MAVVWNSLAIVMLCMIVIQCKAIISTGLQQGASSTQPR